MQPVRARERARGRCRAVLARLTLSTPPAAAQQFEQASFALKVGEISEIVDSDSGSHYILRIE